MTKLASGPREGWLSLFLLFAIVLTPAVSLAQAAWVAGLDVVPKLTLVGLLLGVVLAKSRVRAWLAHLFTAEFGLFLIGFYVAADMPGATWLEKFDSLRERIWTWIAAAISGGISNDTMLFVLLMSIAGWFLGYAAAWLAFRKNNVWFALVASGSALLVNISYVSVQDSVGYFLVYLFASMLLLIRTTLYERERDWHRSDADYNRSLSWGFLWKGAALSVTIVILAWAMPTGTVNASVAENWAQVTGPWQGLQGEFDRMFASVGASTVKAEGNRFTKTLALKGAIELGPSLVMQVASPRPDYWATQTYDKYTGQGWVSSSTETTRLDANDNRLTDTSQYAGRVDIEQHFMVVAGRSTNLYAASSPVKLSLPVNAENFGSLDDLSALKSVVPLRIGQQYSVISSVSVASAEELRSAGTEYPDWLAKYLDLPQGTGFRLNGANTRRVQAMTRRVVSGAGNPYDSALAIEKYLRGFTYDIKVTAPPPDRDAVDWFLFTSKQGYCDYFASAMAVMARSIGIPSRVVSGYNTGIHNDQTGLFEVHQENAHSWPELFFPKYGWVRFEPTPSQPASSRPDTPLALQNDPAPANGNSAEALDLETQGRDRLLLDDGSDLFDPQAGGSSGTRLPDWPVLALLAAVPVLAAAGAFAWRRGIGALSAAEWAYLQTYAVAGLLGWRMRPSNTPAEYGRTLSSASPDLAQDLDRVVGSYEQETYGGGGAASDEVRESSERIRRRLPLSLLRRRLGL
ncbi:MAG TPA: transglutaminaseTgpA domain-containing protein [Chloroflexota bacterium]